MEQESTVQRPRRREYSAEFKGAVLEQCRQQGASVAGAALGYGLNQDQSPALGSACWCSASGASGGGIGQP